MPIEYHLGGHIKTDFEQAQIVIVNPAVPPGNEYVAVAKEHSALVTSQISLFFELCPAMIVGITGSVGKSTTAALTAHLLKASLGHNRKVWLSGNIGNEPLLMLLDNIAECDVVVLELSSFHIEQLAQFRLAPQVALLTNLMPNHLDRYGTFENYCRAKEGLFKFQKASEKEPAVSIFNSEDKISCEWFDEYRKDKGRCCINFSAEDVGDDIRSCFTLPGRANLSNLAAAIAVIKHFGVRAEGIKKALGEFKALPHRLELVAERNGVRWYNDSKATTPESAIAALEAFEEPTIIIAGGYDKNLPFDALGRAIAGKAKVAVLTGQTAEKIKEGVRRGTKSIRRTADFASLNTGTEIRICDSLELAVETANKLAQSGDVVLLSPACASYDMFANYQQRGLRFCRLVTGLSCGL
jgi:UDP-N-acetylmuramoylalanine--D-glutamate ligase